MNLFRSEEHLTRWLHHWHAAGDYVLPVGDWAKVFSAPTFRRRLDPDYLARAPEYLEEYRRALQAAGKALPAPDRVLSTVMFTDIVESTRQAADVGDSEWRALIRRHDDIVRSQLQHFAGREIDRTGDGFLSTFASPARAIRCAQAICAAMHSIGLRVRAAVHSGARISALAGPNEVLVSQTVKVAVIGSGITFDDRGTHDLKGVPGQWQLYAV